MGGLFGGGKASTRSSAPSGPTRIDKPGMVDVSNSTNLFRQQASQRRGRLSSILASGSSLFGRLFLGQ